MQTQSRLTKEKREYSRLEINIPVHYLLRKPGGPMEVTASTHDIGGGGICLELEEPLPLHSPLELQIKLPTGPHSLVIQGKIAWCEKVPPSSERYRIGIAFHGINEGDRQEIVDYIGKALN